MNAETLQISPWISVPVGVFLFWLFFIALPVWVVSFFDSSPPPPAKCVDLSKNVSKYSRKAQENVLCASLITEQRRYGREGQYGRDVVVAVDHLPEDLIGYEVSAYQKWLVKHGPETLVFSRTEKHK